MYKEYLIVTAIFLAAFSFEVIAETCVLPDGEIIQSCKKVDENANVLVSWEFAKEREDNSVLPLDEIAGTKVYFNRLVDNWWPKANTYDNTVKAVYVNLPAGEYTIFGTTIDTDDQESIPSNKITSTIVDAVESRPKPNAPVFSVTTTTITKISIQ